MLKTEAEAMDLIRAGLMWKSKFWHQDHFGLKDLTSLTLTATTYLNACMKTAIKLCYSKLANNYYKPLKG